MELMIKEDYREFFKKDYDIGFFENVYIDFWYDYYIIEVSVMCFIMNYFIYDMVFIFII